MPPEQVIAGLRQAKAQAQNAHKQNRTGIIILSCIVGYVSLFFVLFTALGWIFGDWDFADLGIPIIFGFITFLALILLMVAIIIYVQNKRTEHPTSQSRDRQPASKILLAALPTLDDTIAPRIEHIGVTDLELYLPAKRRRITLPQSLQLQPAGANYLRLMLVVFGLFNATYPLLQLQSDEVFTGMNISSRQESIFMLPISLSIFVLITFGLSFSFAVDGIRPHVFLDEQGVWWRRWRGWAHMPWMSIRTIGIYQRDTPYNMGTTYVIDAEEQLISWSIQASSSARARAGSLQLLRFAEARSGRPIRNLEPLVDAIAREYPTKSGRSYLLKKAEPDVTISVRVAALLANSAPQQPTATSIKNLVLGAMFLIGLASIPSGGTLALQNIAQPAYFASLPAKIHVKTPIFVDGLRQPNGLLPVRKPTTNDPGNYAYTPTGYTISGTPSRFEDFAIISRTFSAVAIEVTVKENGSIASVDQGGVGIIARHHGKYDFDDLRFTINNKGDWSLSNGDGFLGMSGHSADVHTWPGAINTLLVIARGNLYIGYVNGHYVVQYFDEINFAGATGQIGLVNLGSGITATFTDLKVWQVNAPPALTIV